MQVRMIVTVNVHHRKIEEPEHGSELYNELRDLARIAVHGAVKEAEDSEDFRPMKKQVTIGLTTVDLLPEYEEDENPLV